jgi:hypothetical protein
VNVPEMEGAGWAIVMVRGPRVDRSALRRPIKKGDLAEGEVCQACGQPIRAGQVAVHVPLGPGDDPNARELCRAGKLYPAIGIIAHAACAGGEEIELCPV